MKILVTGSTGFVGSHLVTHLKKQGHHVKTLSLQERYDGIVVADYTIFSFDIANSLKRIFLDFKPDAVYHIGSLFLKDHLPQDVMRLVYSNVYYTAEICEALSNIGGGKLISIGTYYEHGNDSLYKPISLYAATKRAAKDIITYYQSKNITNHNVTIFDNYGPRDHRNKLIGKLIKAEQNSETITLTNRSNVIDIIHINDLILGLTMALGFDINMESVISGTRLTIGELVELFQSVRGCKLNISWDSSGDSIGYPWAGGIQLIGFSPSISLPEGLKTLQ